jgi:hypothetical protein
MIAAGAEGVSAVDTPSLPAEVSALVEEARAAERLGNRRKARKRHEAAIRRLPRSWHTADASVHLRRSGPETLRELSRAYRLFSQLRAPRGLATVERAEVFGVPSKDRPCRQAFCWRHASRLPTLSPVVARSA